MGVADEDLPPMSRVVPQTAIGLAAVLLAGVLGAATSLPTLASRPQPASSVPGELTVVELFTSQGCSSCPPANANLGVLARRPDVLALSFNVTYWDQLGWKDTFAQDAFTQRQRDYQRGLGNANVWTPQVVVDGRADVVGQRLSQIEGLIARHRPLQGPAIRFRDGGVALTGGSAPPRAADIWLVRYEPHPIAVPVVRGENGGRTLPHADVVRDLVRLGEWRGPAVSYPLPPPSRPGLATAILIQQPDGGRILAAARG